METVQPIGEAIYRESVQAGNYFHESRIAQDLASVDCEDSIMQLTLGQVMTKLAGRMADRGIEQDIIGVK